MTASNYLGNAILDGFLRGVAITVPATDVYVSLHTADPGATGASECTTGTWPAYARQSAKQGGALSAAFAAASSKYASNAKQIIFPAYDGTGTVTITHYALWDAATGGNCLYTGKLVVDPTDVTSTAAPRTLAPTDELAIYPNQIGFKVT